MKNEIPSWKSVLDSGKAGQHIWRRRWNNRDCPSLGMVQFTIGSLVLKFHSYYRWEIHGSAVHPCIHHKYQERMECSAHPLPKVSGCHDNSKLTTKNVYSYERFVQGLRKLINEMFEAPFASSSVGVTFSRYNTLTVGIPDDGSTRDHLIEFSITPPTVKKPILKDFCHN